MLRSVYRQLSSKQVRSGLQLVTARQCSTMKGADNDGKSNNNMPDNSVFTDPNEPSKAEVSFLGRVVNHPEIEQDVNGKTYIRLVMGLRSSRQVSTPSYDWYTCYAFEEPLVKEFSKSLQKGDRINLLGELRYQRTAGGSRRSVVHATSIKKV